MTAVLVITKTNLKVNFNRKYLLKKKNTNFVMPLEESDLPPVNEYELTDIVEDFLEYEPYQSGKD